MPWSNQSGGGVVGSGGGGPWGQGPSGGPHQQPDLEELLKRSQDRLKQVMPGGSGIPGPFLFLVAIVMAAVVAYLRVHLHGQPDELGVVMRFGKVDRQEPPGLHFRMPYPIEEVRLPKVTRQNIIEIGMRTRPGHPRRPRDVPEESLMLTGDENIVDVDFVVYWRIKDAQKYLFNIQNPDDTVKEVAESAMREIVGQNNIEPILTEARQKTEQAVQKLMQDVLDYYGSGIRVDQVQLQKVDPPSQVIDAFRDVQAARADKERLQNEAFAYANRIVPEARGDAERILQGAKGYQQQTVAEATGQTARFLKVYDEYKKAPDVTRKRLYLETMERVLGGADKIIIDSKADQGVVPYLPLDQLQQEGRGQLMLQSTLGDHRCDTRRCGSCRHYFSFFIVHQNEQAIVLEFGKPVRIINDPGLYWKIPVVQTVDYFDKRILDLDTASQEVTASDQKRLIVDAFARYRIIDPLLFYQIGARRTRGALAPGTDRRIRRCAACSAARRSRTSCATSARR